MVPRIPATKLPSSQMRLTAGCFVTFMSSRKDKSYVGATVCAPISAFTHATKVLDFILEAFANMVRNVGCMLEVALQLKTKPEPRALAWPEDAPCCTIVARTGPHAGFVKDDNSIGCCLPQIPCIGDAYLAVKLIQASIFLRSRFYKVKYVWSELLIW